MGRMKNRTFPRVDAIDEHPIPVQGVCRHSGTRAEKRDEAHRFGMPRRKRTTRGWWTGIRVVPKTVVVKVPHRHAHCNVPFHVLQRVPRATARLTQATHIAEG